MSGTRRAFPEAFKPEAVDRVRSSGQSVGASRVTTFASGRPVEPL